jgi:4-hydroxythreonine-4-phosphate dehydrogenase
MDKAKYSILSLKTATEDLAAGKVDVLVTAPIDKHSMKYAGFEHAGHTEFLADFANTSEVLMIMVSDDLRVGTITGHLALKDVSAAITADLIIEKVRTMNKSLMRDFHIVKPRIAVLALNPHAGDRGTIGSEDQDIIVPAIKALNEESILAFGPFPADGFFGSGELFAYDGIMAMYHDQGLAPFKALSFQTGVNYTAGLPIVRTSPVHGTGLQIAGQGKADPTSFRNAVLLAKDIFKNRTNHREMNADPLQPQAKARTRNERA